MENNSKKLFITSISKKLVINPNDSTNSVSLSPDGNSIVSGSSDNTVRLWNVSLGEFIKELKGHTKPVLSVSWSSDGLNIVSGSADNTVRIWNVSSGEFIKELKGHTDSVSSVSCSPYGNSIVSGSSDNTVRIWNVSPGEFIKELKGHTLDVMSVSWSPDGLHIVSGSADKTVRMWDATSGQCIKVLEGHTSDVYSVSWSPNGLCIVSGSIDKTVRVWDARSEKCIKVLKGHTDSVSSVSWSPDGLYIVSGSDDMTVRVWNVESEVCINVLKGHTSYVNAVCFSPVWNQIVSCSIAEIIIWDIVKGNLGLYPEINKSLDLLQQDQKKKYIIKIISNYTEFSKYFVKNYLIKNGTEIKNMDYNEFFKLIGPFLPLNNISKFADIIIEFIESIPKELNKSFYSGHINGSNQTRIFILEIYKNIMIEYINFLQKFFKFNKIHYSNSPQYHKTKRDNELELLLEAFKSKIINPNSRVKIIYIEEQGINLGGLSREFFKNLEKQLNSKKDLSEKEIIDILVFSKVNKNPIYIENNTLKQLILKKITNNIKKYLNKNVIYNFLYNAGNINYQMKDLVFLTNNNIDILPLGYTKTQLNNYIKKKSDENIKKKSNENIKKKSDENINNPNINNPNIGNPKNDFFIHYINCKFDINKIYKNFLDFYISHFINFSLNINDIINNLIFSKNATSEFIVKFKGLLKNLSEDELKKFNECISGSFKLQPKYKIKIINYGNKIIKYSTYHTCFSTMDIYGMDNFIKIFLQFKNNSNNYKKLVINEQCKKDFMETINTALELGFNMA